MPEYIFLMHSDTVTDENYADWEIYVERLNGTGQFRGGSSIGCGQAYRKGHIAAPAGEHINGFIRIEAENLAEARNLLAGNPTFDAGGTVEIREIIED